MSEREHGGTEATDAEAAAVLSILFADKTGDAVRALRAYAARSTPMPALRMAYRELLTADANGGVTVSRTAAINAVRAALGEEASEEVRLGWLLASRVR